MSEALAKPGQLTICYIPPDGRGQAKNLTVAEEVALQHLAAHQDAFLGTCGGTENLRKMSYLSSARPWRVHVQETSWAGKRRKTVGGYFRRVTGWSPY